MFPVSDFALEIIRSEDRSFEWFGTITFSDGSVINFDMSNIVQGTGYLRNSCNAPGIGEMIATEFSAEMLLDIEVERLKNAVINLKCQVSSDINIDTWGGASAYSWIDLSGVKWGDEHKTLSVLIPMGEFSITKAKRKISGVSITAYDNAQKFDVEFSEIDDSARTPYNWLLWACNNCNIGLGMTHDEVMTFPNGTRLFSYANVNNDAKTYRHIIQRLASALCSVAIMDRYGQLKLVPCASEPIMTVEPKDRFSSEFEDYKTSFTGIYLQHKPSGTQKYYTNADDPVEDTGSIIDLGANPFLQSSIDLVRDASVQAIIDGMKNFAITPFEMTMPFDPTIELMDVVSFTGGHVSNNALAPITDFTRRINGDMSIRCDISETSANMLRADKITDGASGSGSSNDSYGNTSFWLNTDSFPSEETVVSGEKQTTDLTVELTVDNTRVQVAWTGTYTLSTNAIVTAKVYVENDLVYAISDMQTSGKHSLSVTTGHDIFGTGTYRFKVVLGVSAGILTLPPGSARLTVLGYGWYGVITSGDSWTEYGQIFKNIADLLEYEYPTDVNWDDVAGDYQFDELLIDKDGMSITENNFNGVVVKLDKKFPTRNHNKKYKIKTYKNKNYISTNQEGNDSLPYSIKIEQKPDKIMYVAGESISIDGMIVKAYGVAGDLWTSSQYPDGIIPNSELTIAPDKAPGNEGDSDGNNNS